MQRTIMALQERQGLADAFRQADDFHLRIENPPWLALVIERHGDEVSIAHYVEQNGDLIPDPEMTFSFRRAEESTCGRLTGWVPLTINPGGFGERAVAFFDEGGQFRYYPRAFADAQKFARTWAKNIREQGFLKKGLQLVSDTHAVLLPNSGDGQEDEDHIPDDDDGSGQCPQCQGFLMGGQCEDCGYVIED